MTHEIAILGAGIIGSLTAYRLIKAGKQVRLFDELPRNSPYRASAAAAGLLAPYSERDLAPEPITTVGTISIGRWKAILDDLGRGIYFQQAGTLVVAHPGDEGLIQRLRAQLAGYACYEPVAREKLLTLEPELDPRFSTGLYFKDEAQLDAPALLNRLHDWIEAEGQPIAWASTKPEGDHFSHVIDCRGFKAQETFPELRGIRGERILVEAPHVHLNRPVRVMHPRYPLYVLPRAESRYVVGATVIESESLHPITVRSSLELLSAAYAVHSGFGEARVLESRVGIRPVLPHALPEIRRRAHRLEANGLYRHGYLLGPEVAQGIEDLILTGGTRCPFFKENA